LPVSHVHPTVRRSSPRKPIRFLWPGRRPELQRETETATTGSSSSFRAYPGRGGSLDLASTQHGRLDQKGIVVDPRAEQRRGHSPVSRLEPRPTASFGTTLPSARGRARAGPARAWVADSSQADRLLVHRRLAGPRSPPSTPRRPGIRQRFPAWAAGLLAVENSAYRTQEETARRRSRVQAARIAALRDRLATSSTWPHQGDWCFEPSEWPDPRANGP